MKRLVLLFSLLAIVSTPGCKRKQLEAELKRVKGDLASEQASNQSLRQEKQSLQGKIGELETNLQGLNQRIDELISKQGTTGKELEELRREKAKREQELAVYKDIFAKLKSLIDAGTIEVTFRKGQLVVKLSAAILFDSGKTELKPEGQTALANLAPALQSVNRDFLVAGHTDNVPIKTARFKNNWELSTARAVVVVQFLISKGFPAAHVGAAGYGEYDPLGDNTSEAGRAFNRRIEIILTPNLGEIPGLKESLNK